MTLSWITHLVQSYGYYAVFTLIALESMGIPLPGETALISAALYAGTTHHLNVAVLAVVATCAAIIGDNAGYWIGRTGGYRLAERYGRYVRLDRAKLKVSRYLFARHGWKVVFFGRFVAVLRTFAAFFAGVGQMRWPAFAAANAAAACCGQASTPSAHTPSAAPRPASEARSPSSGTRSPAWRPLPRPSWCEGPCGASNNKPTTPSPMSRQPAQRRRYQSARWFSRRSLRWRRPPSTATETYLEPILRTALDGLRSRPVWAPRISPGYGRRTPYWVKRSLRRRRQRRPEASGSSRLAFVEDNGDIGHPHVP